LQNLLKQIFIQYNQEMILFKEI